MTTNAIVLSEQLKQLEALKTILAQELDLIVGRDADALLSLVGKKQQLLDNINADTQLITLLQTAPDQLTESQATDIKQAKKLLEECQHQTEVNSLAVQKNQIRVETLRRMLIESRNKESMTYDKAGKAQNRNLGGGVKA